MSVLNESIKRVLREYVEGIDPETKKTFKAEAKNKLLRIVKGGKEYLYKLTKPGRFIDNDIDVVDLKQVDGEYVITLDHLLMKQKTQPISKDTIDYIISNIGRQYIELPTLIDPETEEEYNLTLEME